MSPTATCPNCGKKNTLPPCSNCHGTEWERGQLDVFLDGGPEGLVCKGCISGASVGMNCASCRVFISYEKFTTMRHYGF